MYAGRTIFAQLMDLFPTRRFHTCVRRYQGDLRIRRFTCLDQFRVMAFAQLTYRESLRDIEACLRAMQPKLFHMGIGHCAPRSTLAEANEKRDWRIFADIAQVLISRARSLYAGEDFGQELKDATLYALGRQHHRPLPLALSLGALPQDKSRREASHPYGPARQHPRLHPHLRWKAARRQYLGPFAPRTRRLLCHGPRLSRFQTPVLASPGIRLLCHPRQNKLQIPPPLLAPRGQADRPKMRPDRDAD